MYKYDDAYNQQIEQSQSMFRVWKNIPAPVRGEMIREFGNVLREQKESIAQAITHSMYKTIRESRGEVQEVIDMCDFAVGLSRQLYGLTMPSERPDHRLQELWLPLGVVGVITAFNFPCAVWGWNFCLAAICGDTVVWKPSDKSKGVAELMQSSWAEACDRQGKVHFVDVSVVLDDSVHTGIAMCEDPRVSLVSATGSVRMGKEVAKSVGARLGKTLLELGGNNSAIVSEKADLDLAVKGCVFGAVGTTGQRCTSLRRAFVHKSIYKAFVAKMIVAYKTIKIGDPVDE
ncbi:aldehyde dehydrogenase family protein, partial [Candidatus Thorarchaeota archaeon]